MPLVEFRGVSYEIAGRPILSDLSLGVDAGQTLVLLGRSGSGKTTALKMINGLLFPTRGQVLVDGRATTDWDPIKLRRRIGYVIQEVGLFPHFTVGDNVGLVPKLEGWSPADVENRVKLLLDTVGMPAQEFQTRYPRQLSGGQRQRVGSCACFGSRSSSPSLRRTLRRARPCDAAGIAATVPGAAAGFSEDFGIRHARCARSSAAGKPGRAAERRASGCDGSAAGIPPGADG